MLKELMAIAWPPYRLKLERHQGWCIVSGAYLHLLKHDDWGKGDHEAGKILGQRLRMLNK